MTERRYRDAAAYVRALIEADRERHAKHATDIAKLREQISIGAEQLERGEYSRYTDETLDGLLDETESLGQAILTKSRAGGME